MTSGQRLFHVLFDKGFSSVKDNSIIICACCCLNTMTMIRHNSTAVQSLTSYQYRNSHYKNKMRWYANSHIFIMEFHLPWNSSDSWVWVGYTDVVKYILSPRLKQNHDDVIKWKNFPCYWPFVRGIHRSPVNSPHKGQWRGALMFSLIWVWINGWVNNGEAGDLRRYRAHYDVLVMTYHGEIVLVNNIS